ncbi:uncharacterized protein LOC111088854 [Limulus polyphemus]|uniref:Uncharacterized protein LOC111088854 n=1 Tax=Limulus polyphemus TaxID=6850 RepID=A0ABM1TII2_LIMPO|nr:uncharacterized protein LOC111088854 [Limulus polyphemus]
MFLSQWVEQVEPVLFIKPYLCLHEGQRKENNNPSDRVIENGVSPDKTLPFVSSRRQQNKRSSPVILCSTSSFRALPLSSSVSLPGLNVSDNYDPPKCLTPIQGLKSNTGNLPLSSVKELGMPSRCFGAKRNVKQLGE